MWLYRVMDTSPDTAWVCLSKAIGPRTEFSIEGSLQAGGGGANEPLFPHAVRGRKEVRLIKDGSCVMKERNCPIGTKGVMFFESFSRQGKRVFVSFLGR